MFLFTFTSHLYYTKYKTERERKKTVENCRILIAIKTTEETHT
jgi:hypothetical protein